MERNSGHCCTRLVAVTVVLAAVAFACSGGSGGKVTPTSTPVTPIDPRVLFRTPRPTFEPTATLGPTAGWFDDVYFVDQQHGWVSGKVGNKGVILATKDGGQTWQKQLTPPEEVWRLTFVSAQVGWALAGDGSGSELLRTTDGGGHWTQLSHIDQAAQRSRSGLIDFVSPEIGWAVAGERKLLKTIDGGRTWTDTGLTNVSSVCFGDADHGWATTASGVLRTTDGGVTWSETELKSGEIQCTGSQEAWVRSTGPFVGGTIIDYVLWHTADGGIHWNPVLGHQSSGPLVNSIPTDPGPQPGPWTIGNNGSAYFVGFCAPCDTSTLVVTHDQGVTWGAPVPLSALPRAHAMSFSDASHGWVVGGTSGQHLSNPMILATSDGGQTWVQQYP